MQHNQGQHADDCRNQHRRYLPERPIVLRRCHLDGDKQGQQQQATHCQQIEQKPPLGFVFLGAAQQQPAQGE